MIFYLYQGKLESTMYNSEFHVLFTQSSGTIDLKIQKNISEKFYQKNYNSEINTEFFRKPSRYCPF